MSEINKSVFQPVFKSLFTSIFAIEAVSPFPLTDLEFNGSTLTNTPAGFVDKNGMMAAFKDSYCLDFDAIDDYISLQTTITHLLNTGNPFSFRCFLNLDSITAAYLFTQYNSTEQKGMNLTIINGNPTLLLRSSLSNNLKVSMTNTPLAINFDYELHVSYDGSKTGAGVQIAVNRVAMTTNIESNNLTDTNITPTIPTAYIGCTWNGSVRSSFMNGRIWGMKIWNSVVSAIDDTTVPALLDMPFACGPGADLTCDRSASANHGVLNTFNNVSAWLKQSVYHENIKNGFTAIIKGNASTGYYRIAADAFKNYGLNNFYIRARFLSPTNITATVKKIVATVITDTEVKTGFFISQTSGGGLNCAIALNDIILISASPLASGLMPNTLYDVVYAINRTTGKVYSFLNQVYVSQNSISAYAGVPVNSTADFYLHATPVNNTQTTITQYSDYNLLSYETGLATIDETTDVSTLVADLGQLIASPNSTTIIDKISNVKYTPTGTVYNINVPTKNTDTTKDVSGGDTLYPAGNYHNGAETIVAFNETTNLTNAKGLSVLGRPHEVSAPSTKAYGIWEFKNIRVGASLVWNMLFIHNTERYDEVGDGYLLYFTTTGIFRIRRKTGSTYTSLFSYSSVPLTAYNNFDVKITRNETVDQYHTGPIGSFALWIRGGAISEDYILLPTPDVGTNPSAAETAYTTSSYIVSQYDGVYNKFSYLYDFNATLTVHKGTVRALNADIENAPGVLNSFGGSNTSSRLSSKAYGEWEITLRRDNDAVFFYYGFLSTSNASNVNGYSIVINGSNQLLIRRYISSAILNMTTAFGIGSISGKTVKIKVQRNQTENEVFTGVANAMRIGIKGHNSTYPVDGTTYEWSDVSTDATYTTNSFETIACSTTDTISISDIAHNGVSTSLCKFNSITTAFQFKNLNRYFWLNAITPTISSFFYRHLLRDNYSIRNDRFLIYDKVQVEPALTKINTYVADVAL